MGVAILNGWPANSGAASFSEIRRASEGDFARTAAGVVRAGILPAHTDPIVTARATMGVNVLDFRAVLSRDGAIRIANVGTKIVPLAAAPAANRRIDVVVATQFDPAAPLSDAAPSDGNWAFLEVVQGTASATPVKPALPSRLNGALELATIEVPAGATTTQSAGVVITQTAPFTAGAGGVVTARTRTELAAWTPVDGSEAYCMEDKVKYLRTGGDWAGGSTLMHLTTTQITTGYTVMSSASQWAMQGPGMGSTPWTTGLYAPWAGEYSLNAGFYLGATVPLLFMMKLNNILANAVGAVALEGPNPHGNITAGSVSRTIRLNAGDRLTPAIYFSGAGGPYGLSGGTPTWCSLEFLRP